MSIEDVLELMKQEIENIDVVSDKYLVSNGNNNGFEILVPEIIEKIKNIIPDQLEMVIHLNHHFPDLDLILNGKKYGIELKSRNNGLWDTNGNSVFESISNEKYEEIYVFFGTHTKKIPKINIMYKPYWQVTSNILVTHSPRFKINMNSDTSVFKNANEYHNLKKMTEIEKIDFLQNYLKNNTQGSKWFVSQNINSVKPILFDSIDKKNKNRIISELLILFPHDLLGHSKGNYSRSSEYIVENYFYYSPSFRDKFSAGGKWELNGVLFPKIIKSIFDYKEIIKNLLSESNEDYKKNCYKNWKEIIPTLTPTNFEKDYCLVLDTIGDSRFPDELIKANVNKLSKLLYL